MTSEDRALLQKLIEQQKKLEYSLSLLQWQLKALELRADQVDAPVVAKTLPPLPISEISMTELPPSQTIANEPIAEEVSMETKVEDEISALPLDFQKSNFVVTEPDASKSDPSLIPKIPPVPAYVLPPIPSLNRENKEQHREIQLGRWLARIGIVFALITLVSFSTLAYKDFYQYMGPESKVGVILLVSIALTAGGLRLEKMNPKMTVYGRTLAAGGLSCLYYTLYAARYVEPLQLIQSNFISGSLLLAWSAYVLYLAESKNSELLSIFSIALAYFSSALTPVGPFTLVTNLALALTAIVFLIRNSWAGLSYLCLFGSYFGILQQYFHYDSTSAYGFVSVPGPDYYLSAGYLFGAWAIYTEGVLLSKSETFIGGKRLAFLCLNNGIWIGLTVWVDNWTSFGNIGLTLSLFGLLVLVTSRLAYRLQSAWNEVSSAYLLQGLALFTAGLAIHYTGLERGLLLLIESGFIVAAAAYANNRLLKIAAAITALIGTYYLNFEIHSESNFPLIISLIGALAMFCNSGLARYEFWKLPVEEARHRFVGSSVYYSLLGIVMIYNGSLTLPEAWIAPSLTGFALLLTFLIYFLPIPELPFIAQLLLVFGQGQAILPWSKVQFFGLNHGLVLLATLFLSIWWSRQKFFKFVRKFWLLVCLYACASVLLSLQILATYSNDTGWLIGTSGLSLAFLSFGILNRSWPYFLASQVTLLISLMAYFAPNQISFPWTDLAASATIVSVYSYTLLAAWGAKKVFSEKISTVFSGIISVYRFVIIAMIIRFIFGVVDIEIQVLSFYLLATIFIVLSLLTRKNFGLYGAYIFNSVGTLFYLYQTAAFAHYGATWENGLGLLLLFAQPVILKRWGAELISAGEMIGIIFASNLSLTIFLWTWIYPDTDNTTWMAAASLLSLGFVGYGLWMRAWPFLISGGIYLIASLVDFFNLTQLYATQSWLFYSALVPPIAVFLHIILIRFWAKTHNELSPEIQDNAQVITTTLIILDLILIIRWLILALPASAVTLALISLGTGIVIFNLSKPNLFGLRLGFAVSAFGFIWFLVHRSTDTTASLTSDSLACLIFLAQPGLLRYLGKSLVSSFESWGVILLSTLMAWIANSDLFTLTLLGNLTLAWALCSLLIISLGFAFWERRQRWCGLTILIFAMLRGGVYDFWSLSDLGKVLTFFALTVICLGLSFVYYRFADALKKWL